MTEKLGEVGETMENYVRQLRDDQFIGKERETPQQKYTRLESALDKLKMTIEKRDIVTTKGKEVIEVLKEVIGKIEKITKEGESNESTLKKMNNEMIDEILTARQEERIKVKKQIKEIREEFEKGKLTYTLLLVYWNSALTALELPGELLLLFSHSVVSESL